MYTCDHRGPTYGYRGKVVRAFEDNEASKIGVRFDKSIPEGNDLGGLCEEDHGFFCAGSFLLLSILKNFIFVCVAHQFGITKYVLLLKLDLFSYTADLLRVDSSSSDDIDKLAIDELFEVIFMYIIAFLSWTSIQVSFL